MSDTAAVIALQLAFATHEGEPLQVRVGLNAGEGVRYRAQVARFRNLRTRGGEGKRRMQASEVSRAVAAAMSTASGLGLKSTNAIVLHNSNNLALRLLPCDVFA